MGVPITASKRTVRSSAMRRATLWLTYCIVGYILPNDEVSLLNTQLAKINHSPLSLSVKGGG
jgi:hypothetical protein